MTEENRKFTKLFILTSLPIAFQNLLQNSLSFIDTIMIGRLGENALAAVGIGAQIFFLIMVILFGVASGCGIFFSQFWGSKDTNGIQKTTDLGLTCGVVVALIFALISTFAPQVIVRFFVEDGIVFELGCIYLKWTGVSFVFTAISMVLGSLFRSVGNPTLPMIITLISMLTDVVGNYILIFVCNMGVQGAAIATTLSRLLEAVLLLFAVSFKSPVKLDLKKLGQVDGVFAKKVLKTSLPVLIDDGLWALGMTVYKIIHAHMGVDVLASVNVMGTIQDMFFVFQNGLGAAGSVLIGNEIGKGEKERAFEYSKLSLFYGVIAGAVTTFMMIGLSSYIPKLFSLSPAVYDITVKSMITLSLLMPVKFANHMNVVGILRSGGDTKFILFVETFSVWCVGVPMTFLSGIVWGLPIFIVYLFTNMEEVIKLFIVIPRIFSKKWINVLSQN